MSSPSGCGMNRFVGFELCQLRIESGRTLINRRTLTNRRTCAKDPDKNCNVMCAKGYGFGVRIWKKECSDSAYYYTESVLQESRRYYHSETGLCWNRTEPWLGSQFCHNFGNKFFSLRSLCCADPFSGNTVLIPFTGPLCVGEYTPLFPFRLCGF